MPNDTNSKPRFRLSGMAIHTLGFVDRGANNKRWIVAKRAEPEAATSPAPVEPEAMTPPAENLAEEVIKTNAETAVETPPTQQPETPPTAPEPDPVEVEKGLRVAQARLAQMWSAFNAMADLMKDLVAEVTTPRIPKPAAAPEFDPISMAVMQKRAKEQDAELARLRKNHGSSNSIPVDGSPGVVTQFVWPSDLNELRKDPRFVRGK